MSSYIYQIMTDPKIFLFGTGFSFGNAFDVYDFRGELVNAGLAHNVFLDTWGLSGIIGVLFQIYFFLFIIKDLKGLIHASTFLSPTEKNYAFTFSITILYFMQFLLVQANGADRSFMIVFYFCAGLLKPLKNFIINNYNRKINYGLVNV